MARGSRSRLALWGSVALVMLGLALGALLLARARTNAGTAVTAPAAEELVQRAAQRRSRIDAQIESLQSRLSRGPADPTAYALLGLAYLQKARDTNNPTFYGKAETALGRALQIEPGNPEALQGMGMLALARHHFQEALAWGERAVKANPYRAANYGIVGDALVELGRYDEAVAVFQKMVDTRPDLASYARVAYLRELHGQVEGAIEAMQRAVTAGGPTPENTEYVRVQLGNLYFNNGRLEEAERQYRISLQFLPDYGPALAGLAHVHAARGEDDRALALLTKATETAPAPEYFIALGDLHMRAGRAQDAARQYSLVRALQALFAANGTDVDVEFALFAADHGLDLPGALARAREGYARRPSIHAADVLAWTLYQSGNPGEAAAYARESLRLGTRDAVKLYHAGMIAKALGKDDEARFYLTQALAINPHFSILQGTSARVALAELGGTAGADAVRRP